MLHRFPNPSATILLIALGALACAGGSAPAGSNGGERAQDAGPGEGPFDAGDDAGVHSDAGPRLDASTPCEDNSQCGPGAQCGFPESAGCSANGTCFPLNTGPLCNSFEPGCSCSGLTINLTCEGYPEGYASAPVASTGPCPSRPDAGLDGGSREDGGSPDASVLTCTSNADCAAGMDCGFEVSAGCGAIGQCFPDNAGPACNAFEPGCSCSGMTLNLVCNGYPSGDASAPVAHMGACQSPSPDAGPVDGGPICQGHTQGSCPGTEVCCECCGAPGPGGCSYSCQPSTPCPLCE
jgi:hypothetical protein